MSEPTEPIVAKVSPGPTEDRKAFISRCMTAEKSSIPDMPQRLAACFSMWSRKANAAGDGCPDPADGEDQQAYLDRCSVDHPEADCRAMWDKMQGGSMPSDNAQHFLSVFNVAQSIPVRREQLDGVEHVVLPIVALVEGTYTCANCNGPNFYPVDEWGKNGAAAWNGRPITIGHPQRGNSYVSAGSTDVWGKERIGTVFNSRVEGDKLHVEAWIDPAAVERAGADAKAVMAAVEDGGQVEVSTAAWVDEVPRVGSHNGKTYRQAQINFQPDHIALLWGQKGACNWADGCGVRVASADDVSRATIHDQQDVKAACCDACTHGEPCTAEIQETVDALTAAIEVLTGHGFTVTFDEGDGEMADDPKAQAAVDSAPSEDKTKQLELPVQGEPKTQTGLSAEQRRIAELEAKVEHLTAQAAKKPSAQTVEEYIDQAPAVMRETLLQLHKAAERRRLELVDKVKQAPGCMFSQEQLDAMQEKDLLPLVALIARTDFSIQPPVNSKFASDGDDFAELPPSVWAPRDPHRPAS